MSTATIDRTARIRELNDSLRTTFGGGKIMLSTSVAELGHELKAAALMHMRQFSDFNTDNDPHGEHDCFSFELGHYSFIAKIDYYDKRLEYGSEDPSDPEQTTRVLTLMMSSDY